MGDIDRRGTRVREMRCWASVGNRARRGSTVAVAVLGGTSVLLAVSGGGAYASARHPASAHGSRRATGVVISTAKHASLGTILVAQHRTVYVLSPTTAKCTAACQSFWPEVTLAKGALHAIAGAGVTNARLGSIARPGGVRQVTYAGRALYWFRGDASNGAVNGNGARDAWGTWSVLVTVKVKKSPPPKVRATTHATTTTIGSSYGY